MLKSDVSSFRKLKLFFLCPFLALTLFGFRSPEYNYFRQAEPGTVVEPLSASIQKQAGGIVVDEEGNPLQGVRVLVSKSTTFSTTDERGRFSISKVPDGSSLIFSCQGYKTYTMLPLIVTNTGIRVRMVKDPEFRMAPVIKADTCSGVCCPAGRIQKKGN